MLRPLQPTHRPPTPAIDSDPPPPPPPPNKPPPPPPPPIHNFRVQQIVSCPQRVVYWSFYGHEGGLLAVLR
eukprot:COSAG04_NODE_21102_length_380_cov_0.612100_1_plen_70_part_01